MFADQAWAVSLGLAASYAVSITLLPVLYALLHQRMAKAFPARADRAIEGQAWHFRLYKTGYRLAFSRPLLLTAFLLSGVLAGALAWPRLERRVMPELSRDDGLLHVVLPRNFTPAETALRLKRVFEQVGDSGRVGYSALIGPHQFMFAEKGQQSINQTTLYIKALNGDIEALENRVLELLRAQGITELRLERVPSAPEQIFDSDAPLLLARFALTTSEQTAAPDKAQELLRNLAPRLPKIRLEPPTTELFAELEILQAQCMLYEVSEIQLVEYLKTYFSENREGDLQTVSRRVPIVLGQEAGRVEALLDQGQVPNAQGQPVPLRELVRMRQSTDYQMLVGGKDGEFLPVRIEEAADPEASMASISSFLESDPQWQASFTGTWFESRELMLRLAYVLAISILLLYFIMAAQLESLWQPIIVLVELPIDMGFVLFVLWLSDISLNLMSGIGIVVMSGIVINDSILKMDLIKHNIKKGMPIAAAVIDSGERRLNAILMTSLSTILALLPLFFIPGQGSELQMPLAVALIAGLSFGTLVSLYAVPMMYQAIAQVLSRR